MKDATDSRIRQRIAARVPLELWRGGERLGRFETRNIALEGAFVETGAQDLEPYEIVTVVVPGRDGHLSHRMLAMVVYRSLEGVGLLYEAEAPELYHRCARATETA